MKKILCAILVIVLAFSILTACAETENPTIPTTTTTQQTTTENTNVSGDLSGYVGYWFLSEDDMTFDASEPDRYADIQVIYVSEILENKYITYYTHLVRDEYRLDYEPSPWDFISRAPIGLDGVNTFPVYGYGFGSPERYTAELKDGKIIVVDGQEETVFNYRTDDSSAFDAVMAHDEQVFRNRYEGYWYMYDIYNPDGDLQINELCIKEFTGDYLTVDYSIGEYRAKDVSVKLEKTSDCFGAFILDTGVIATLIFERHGFCGYGIELYIGSDVYYKQDTVGEEFVGCFSDKTDKSYDADENNYNLSDYKGYWYVEDVREDWGEDGGIGYDNMHIEEVKGNKVTLVYRFAGLTVDSVTVEINNNIGVFDTVFMGEDGGRGIIRFDDDKIYLEVHSPDNGESDILNRDFSHQRSYSLYD